SILSDSLIVIAFFSGPCISMRHNLRANISLLWWLNGKLAVSSIARVVDDGCRDAYENEKERKDECGTESSSLTEETTQPFTRTRARLSSLPLFFLSNSGANNVPLRGCDGDVALVERVDFQLALELCGFARARL